MAQAKLKVILLRATPDPDEACRAGRAALLCQSGSGRFAAEGGERRPTRLCGRVMQRATSP